MPTRRAFLAASAGTLAAPALASFHPRALDIAKALRADRTSPQSAAADEAFWSEVARAYTVDRSVINLNNGSVNPSPAMVQEAVRRYSEYANTAPSAHAYWGVLYPQREGVRTALAQQFGGDREEIAITRNTSESLQILQLGLPLAAGDEVLTTTADYPRMVTTFKQRERREGIRLVQFQLPDAGEPNLSADSYNAEVVRRFEAHITPRTRMILCSHMGFLNGGVQPVRAICDLGRRHNIPVLVDAAHSLAHLDFRIPDLDCDFMGVSLHKWLGAPHGTGLLYVRRDRIKDVWPLMAAADTQDDNIRKFEEIGTHPAAPVLGIAAAVEFHAALGPARKLARFVHLRNHWINRLKQSKFADRIRLHTHLDLAGGIATADFDGLPPDTLRPWLWNTRQIFTTPVNDAADTPEPLRHNTRGLRISPNVYTTIRELDRFGDALEHALEHGIT